MREILFRGKSVNDGEWAFGSLVITTLEPVDDAPIKHYHIEDMTIGCFPNEFQSGISETVDPETVGQFTGLTDKKGKKIFEGDIIEWFAQGESEHPDFGYIEYDEQSFAWRVCWQKYDPDFMEGMQQEYISVIGNIHDNPELL